MPYLKLVKKEHTCHLPTSAGKRGGRGLTAGTVWQCPDCQKQWMLEFKVIMPPSPASPVPSPLHWRAMEPEEYLTPGG